MIWLDFFLQTFVAALAWCLAAAITLGSVVAAVWLATGVHWRLGRRGSGR